MTGLEAEVRAVRVVGERRTAGVEGARQVQRGSPRLDGLDGWIEEAREACVWKTLVGGGWFRREEG